MSDLVICNAAHKCPIEPCSHKKPHATRSEAGCGIQMGMTCRDSGLVCYCAKIENGKYKTIEVKWCPCCGGKGREDVIVEHSISEAKTAS